MIGEEGEEKEEGCYVLTPKGVVRLGKGVLETEEYVCCCSCCPYFCFCCCLLLFFCFFVFISHPHPRNLNGTCATL